MTQNPKLRFKKLDSTNYPDWQQKRLGDVGIISSAGVDKKIVDGEKDIKLLNFMDVVRNSKLDNTIPNQIVTAPDKKIVQCNLLKGDMVLTPSSETKNELAFNSVVMEDLQNTVYSYHVVRLRFTQDIDLDFKQNMLGTDFFKKQTIQLGEGSGQRYVLSLGYFRNLKFKLPQDKKEQKQIADFLSNLDNLIAAHAQKIDALKQYKKYYMQHMFV